MAEADEEDEDNSSENNSNMDSASPSKYSREALQISHPDIDKMDIKIISSSP